MKNQSTNPKISSKLLKAFGAAITASAIATASYAAEDKPAEELTVYIDDLLGQQSTGWDNARDDLLQNAFYEASESINWLESTKVEYNKTPKDDERGYLLFTIIDWERTPSNFYEFRTRASYINPDGDETNLGSFTGIRSGITVTTGHDIGEHFSSAAEEAFVDALEKLEKEIGLS